MDKNFIDFQDKIGYVFKNEELLKTALTHSSYANENKHLGIPSNERLEFLGDSILNLIVSRYIFLNYSHLPEGEMTKIRASVVCEPALKEAALFLDIGKFIKLGKGENLTGGRNRPSILSDAVEAIAGGIYIDGGFDAATEFVLNQLEELIKRSASGVGMIDYKTKLQEELQKNGDVKIVYEVIQESGPDHDKKFSVQVRCKNKILGTGSGKSKKEAEQHAAQRALEGYK